MVVGRLLNLGYFIGCVSMIYFIVQHETKDKLVSLIAAMLPLTAVTMIAWSMFIRVDLLAILFDLIGVYVFLRNKDIPAAFWAIPFFVLAFYTKQSMVVGAAACTIYLLIHNWKRGIAFALIFSINAGAIFVLAVLHTYGGFFNALLLYQRTFPSFTTPVTVLEIVMISVALYLPAVVMAGSYWVKNALSFISIFAVSALLINAFSLFHIGGGINYMVESIFGFCILAGVWLGKTDLSKALGMTITCTIWLFCLLFLALTGMMGTQFPDKEYAVNYYKAVSMIQDANYPILSENAGLVLAAGKVPYYEAFVFQNMAHYGYFNENLLLNDMADGKVEYVITQFAGGTTGRIDKPIEVSIASEYHVILDAATGHAYGFVLYKHN
jgi:hypothetical protein